ncbi:MAG: hypothetical protein ACLVCW_02435 [Campylobacter sp.]
MKFYAPRIFASEMNFISARDLPRGYSLAGTTDLADKQSAEAVNLKF